MNLGKTIQTLRKLKNLTQNELAEKLFVSYQAVSQWENGNTNPDISILPNIADVFGITIDELFDRPKPEVMDQESTIGVSNLEKNKMYIVVLDGNKMIKAIDFKKSKESFQNITIELKGDVKDVVSYFSVEIDGDVKGDVRAGNSVTCGNIDGDAVAGDSITCGNVGENANAGDSITCGNVGGTATAGDSVTCGNIDGDVTAGDSVTCQDINGNVRASEVRCNIINAEKIEADEIYIDKELNIIK
jgi:transcriptional regulator with XRE-family HTH domain